VWLSHPIGWLARKYAVEEEGRAVASLEFGSWTERGALVIDGERLEIVREGWWNPAFHLEHGHERLATARKSGAFARGFTIRHGHEDYRTYPSSWLGREHVLTRRGRDLGRIHVRGFLARRFEIDLDDELVPELRLFTFWLVLLAMRRAAAAAAAAS